MSETPDGDQPNRRSPEPLNIEPEVHHIAINDDVLFAFHAHLTC